MISDMLLQAKELVLMKNKILAEFIENSSKEDLLKIITEIYQLADSIYTDDDPSKIAKALSALTQKYVNPDVNDLQVMHLEGTIKSLEKSLQTKKQQLAELKGEVDF